MAPCPREQYWDALAKTCVSCALICNQRSQHTCTDFCKFLSCRKEQGTYYDHLLGTCVNCASTCGQHTWHCAYFCKNKPRSQENLLSDLRRSQAREVEARSENPGRNQGSEQRGLDAGAAPLGLRLSSDQLVLVYSTLGLCLCFIFCLFLVAAACFLRRRGEPLPRQRAAVPRGPQAKSTHGPATAVNSEALPPPQPVETCSFCFPERRPPTQESTCAGVTLGRARAAALRLCAHAPDGSLGALRVPTQDAGPDA